ncbi:hypothetical protein WICPIJ_005529 [Wickerhamomyces pijperi]|uniref:Uncharacterized protein n=1 Tax=Wickerhamomyces pijperi TaxID=599730 RepID=A0A9P8TM99_WICPI|nr:hypothetical protein WICPIJ_005529 [Wickerhamomyces pijperi]
MGLEVEVEVELKLTVDTVDDENSQYVAAVAVGKAEEGIAVDRKRPVDSLDGSLGQVAAGRSGAGSMDVAVAAARCK